MATAPISVPPTASSIQMRTQPEVCTPGSWRQATGNSPNTRQHAPMAAIAPSGNPTKGQTSMPAATGIDAQHPTAKSEPPSAIFSNGRRCGSGVAGVSDVDLRCIAYFPDGSRMNPPNHMSV